MKLSTELQNCNTIDTIFNFYKIILQNGSKPRRTGRFNVLFT